MKLSELLAHFEDVDREIAADEDERLAEIGRRFAELGVALRKAPDGPAAVEVLAAEGVTPEWMNRPETRRTLDSETRRVLSEFLRPAYH